MDLSLTCSTYTRQETHMEPEHRPLEDYSLQPGGFQVPCGSLPGCRSCFSPNMASMITENFHSFGEPPPSSRPLALCHLTLEPKVCNETITGPNMCNRTYIWRICGRPSRVTSSQTDSILAFPTPPLEGRLAPRVAPATGAPFRVHRKRFGQTGMPESEALSLANCQTTGQLGCLHHYTQIYNIYI